MSRFYVETPHRMGRHIQRVLRLKEGDEIVLFDGKGMEYWGTIESLRFHRVTVKIGKTNTPQRESPIDIILGQGLLKGDKMDYVYQKSTEMGIAAIFPFISSSTIPKKTESLGEDRVRIGQTVRANCSSQSRGHPGFQINFGEPLSRFCKANPLGEGGDNLEGKDEGNR